MNKFISNIPRAFRTLVASPGYSFVAAAILALGISAISTGFAVLRSIVLAPLPYPNSQAILRIRESKMPTFPTFSVSPGDYGAWLNGAKAFDSLAFYRFGASDMTGQGDPVRLQSAIVTSNFFDVFRVVAVEGRTLTKSDDADGEVERAVISYHLWKHYFEGKHSILGHTITLDDKTFIVVGVMPPQFDFPSQYIDIWTSSHLTVADLGNFRSRYGNVVGRINASVPLKVAEVELNTIAERLERDHPESNKGWRPVVDSLQDDIVGNTRGRVELIFLGVCLVLIIACANVASLTLVRANSRIQEFAVRQALGATLFQISSQLVAEGFLIAVAGGVMGSLLSMVTLKLLIAMAPSNIPRLMEIHLDATVLVFVTAISFLSSVIASVVPALLTARRAAFQSIRNGSHSTHGVGRTRTRGALVTAEISLTVVVLFCTGLLGGSLLKLTNVNLGFDPDGAVATRVSLPSTRYLSGPNFSRFFSQINDQIGDLPGVTAVGESQSVPLMNDSMYGVIIDGRAPANRGEEPVANYYSVTPGYFAAMGIKLKQGRLFSQSDKAGSKPVTIVDESFISRYFPNSDALGKRIRPSDSAGDWREIVGVVGSVRQYGPEGDIRPQMYEPFDQRPFRNATVIIRSGNDPNSLMKPLRVIFRTADPGLPVGLVSPLRGLVRQILSSRSFSTSLLAIFSLCALLLAGVGLYSTLAYLVTQMTHQFGIRMAIGASAIDILRLVVTRGLRLAIAGTIVGVVVALSAGRLIAALVVGTSTSDSLTLFTICAVMLMVSLIASVIPGWRAAMIKPMEALRYE